METEFKSTQLIDMVLRVFDLQISHPTRIADGTHARVYRVLLADNPLYIHLHIQPGIIPMEVVAYHKLKEHGIPCPEIIAWKEQSNVAEYSLMIMQAAQGKILADNTVHVTQEDGIYRQMGEMLRKIHTIKIPGFGKLVERNGELVGDSTSLEEFFDERGFGDTNVHYLVDHRLISKKEVNAIQDSDKIIQVSQPKHSSFLHFDFQSKHIFVDNGAITGVIDLGSSIAGDPRFDIAMSLFFMNERQQNSFKHGYGDLANDQLVSDYLIKIAVGKAGWRHRRGNRPLAQEALVVLRSILRHRQ